MTNVLFIIDRIEKLKWANDSSLLLAHHAQEKLQYKIFTCGLNDINFINNLVHFHAQQLEMTDYDKERYILHDTQIMSADRFQFLFFRVDPPFDLKYLTATYLLDLIDQRKTLVVNSPRGLQNNPEKLVVNHFAKFMPQTIITSNLIEVNKFLDKHEQIILKPLYSHGGNDVFFIKKQDVNLHFIFNNLLHKYGHCPVMVQEFLPEVSKGDKRIFLLRGEFLGCFMRVPIKNSILAGMNFGATHIKSELTAREKEICASIKDYLIKNNLYLVGIDVIDGHITEINSTSPTGLKSLNKLYEMDTADICWNIFHEIYNNN